MTIKLEDFYNKRAINNVSKETLLKKLPILPIKLCPECGTILKYYNGNGLTKTYCCNRCANLAKKTKEKKEKTNLKRYGTKHSIQNKEVLKTREINNLKKYGVSHPIKTQKVQDKIKKTNLKKYGVENVSEVKKFKDKRIKTNLKRYGVEFFLEKKEVHDKIKKTNLKKYGVEYVGQVNSFKEKIKKTNLKKYGVEYILQTDKVRNKRKELNINNVILKYKDKINGKIIKIKNGYKYICDICGNEKLYIKPKEKTFFVQRLRLGIILCEKCLPAQSLGTNQRSSIELKLDNEITKLGIKTKHENSIDIFLPDFNIGIEVNGIYWHSTKHKEKDYHKNKLLKFKKEGIQILSFNEYELKFKFDTVLNYIKGKLGLLPSIGASRCLLKKITTKEAKIFCDKYHIHGYSAGQEKYGLIYKKTKELVSVCIVGKNRFKKDGSLEIIRLANKQKIIGGFARFLKIIKTDFSEYKKITTFINAYLGLENNNVFISNGFSFSGYSQPNYNWYSQNLKIKLSRQQTMKHKLIKQHGNLIDNIEELTEDTIMNKLKFLKIYDAGNYKFELLI